MLFMAFIDGMTVGIALAAIVFYVVLKDLRGGHGRTNSN